MNSRAKHKLTRSWQDRDWNRNRRLWYRLPLPLHNTCWALRQDSRGQWVATETILVGFFERAGATVYLTGQSLEQISPLDLFDLPESATAEAERRNLNHDHR